MSLTARVFNVMNYYQLSYDVIDSGKSSERNVVVLKELMSVLLRLKASCIGRFVETTIMFLSDCKRLEIYDAISNWADSQRVHYVLSQVQSAGVDGQGRETYYFREYKNASLQSAIDEMCAQIENAKGRD